MSDDLPDQNLDIPYDWSEFGPKMLALKTDMQRRFVYCMVMNGGRQGLAALQAGYGNGDKHKGDSTATRLMQVPIVLEALEEVTWRELNGMTITAVKALKPILASPTHKNHMRAIEAVLDRTGFSPERRLKIEDKSIPREKVLAELGAYMKKFGIDPVALLGPALGGKLTAIDHEAEEAEVVTVQPKVVRKPPALPKPVAVERTGLEGLEDLL